MNNKITAIAYALAAAVFYATNAPFSKLLLNHIGPTFMAGILYLGAGVGVGIMYLFHLTRNGRHTHTHLMRDIHGAALR